MIATLYKTVKISFNDTYFQGVFLLLIFNIELRKYQFEQWSIIM